MSTYPIILIPCILKDILATTPSLPSQPDIPPLPKKPKAPIEPEKPSLPKLPEGKFSRTGWATGIGIAALTVLTGPLQVVVTGGAIAYAVYDATQGYEQRLQEYERQKKEFDNKLWPKYLAKEAEWQQTKQHLYKEWREKCASIETAWAVKKQILIDEHSKRCEELLKPERIADWRAQQIDQLVDRDLEPSDARTGMWDRTLLENLKATFPKLDIFWGLGLPIPGSERKWFFSTSYAKLLATSVK